MTKIMAVDPGGMTGIAWQQDGALSSITLPGYPGWTAFEFVVFHAPDVLVIERFQTGGRLSADGLRTIELVGALKGWAVWRGRQYVLHTPSMRHAWQSKAEAITDCKGFTEKPVLDFCGGVVRGRTRHENDALAHLLLHLQLGVRGLSNLD